MTSATDKHTVRWFVYTGVGNQRVPRTSTMRGTWPGYDAVCSCGWESRTGGGVRAWVSDLIADHKNAARKESARRISA